MIRLFVENPGQANPNLALRWCVDKETLDELKERGVKNPQLLLLVAQHPNQLRVVEIERKLVPLDQAMEWLEFNRPGRHTVYATIVWDGDSRFRARWLLRKIGGSFEWRMFNCDDKFSRTSWSSLTSEYSLDEGSLDVVVAEEFFAKEPPAWLSWWVNLWFGAMEVSRPTNQCSFRRRAILAFTIQPVPVFIWALLKSLTRLVVAAVLVLCGMRGISFKPVIRPFKLCLDNVWLDMGSSVFLKDKHGKRRSLLLFFVVPIIPVSLFAILSIFNLFFHFGLWLTVVGVVGLVVSAVVLVLLAYFLFYVAGLVGRGLRTILGALLPSLSIEELKRRQQAERKRAEEKAAERTRREKEKQERAQREFAAFYEGLQDVACVGVPLKPKLELLPERRRTVYLRFKDLKAKVCKLYPR